MRVRVRVRVRFRVSLTLTLALAQEREDAEETLKDSGSELKGGWPLVLEASTLKQLGAIKKIGPAPRGRMERLLGRALEDDVEDEGSDMD